MARNLIAPTKVRVLIDATGNPQKVEGAIFRSLAQKKIYAQADHTETGHKPRKNAVPIKVRGKRIAESHWTAIADDPDLIENVWETGQVTLIERLKTIELHDISFDAEEVTDVIEHWATAPTKKSLVTTGRPTAEWWSDFTVELVDIFYTTSIGPNITTNALLDRVLERMTKAGHSKIPDTRSIRETVEKVLKRSREN